MKALTLAIYTIAFLISGGAMAQSTRVLNVYNWSDYIDPKLLEDFQRETGIKVIYDTYDSNEMLEAKLVSGGAGFDLVFPSATFLARQISSGLLQTLDRERLRNAGKISKELDRRLEPYDPGVRHSIVYMWFTTGLAFNEEKVRPRLGGFEPDTWDLIFNKDLLRKLSDCGVYVIDSPEDIFAIALKRNNHSLERASANDLSRASSQLAALRPFIKKFHSSEYISALASGDACLAIGWAGDSFQAQARAQEAGNGVKISYKIPREGTIMSMDVMAIPKAAKNVNEAYELIDFLLRPEVAAKNTNLTKFANGVPESYSLVSPTIAHNPQIFPGAKDAEALFVVSPLPQSVQRTITREWTRIKSGR
jgi:putrescine transport system substrate-binding protein